MSRFLFLPLVLGFVACEEAAPEPYTSDVFWVQIIDDGTVCPDVEITTNFNATPNEVTSVFDVVIESSESTGGEYAYVTRGEDGSIYFNFRGEVLTGTENANNGAIDVAWSNEETFSQIITEDTFTSTVIDESAVEQTLTLRPNNNEENPEYSGSYSRRDYRKLELTETDEWDFFATGIGTQLGETEDYLTWIDDPPGQGNSNVRNRSFLDDCLASDECTFALNEECTRQFTVEAIKLEGADINDFRALDGFDQPNGVE